MANGAEQWPLELHIIVIGDYNYLFAQRQSSLVEKLINASYVRSTRGNCQNTTWHYNHANKFIYILYEK